MKKVFIGGLCLLILFFSVSCAPVTSPMNQNGTTTVQIPTSSATITEEEGIPTTTVTSSTDVTTVTKNQSVSHTTTMQSLSTHTTVKTITTNSTVATTTTTTHTTTTTAVTTESTATEALTTNSATTVTTTTRSNPPPSQEMRGVWVSYIELNEIFQTCRGVEQAKTAVDTMMKRIKNCNLNTVFFHVRANSDAYYASQHFRTAKTVEALLQAGFDPLAYAVESAHRYGLELHAWINPYRVGTKEEYIVKGIPTFSKTLNGITRYYYVPTDLATQKLVLDGVEEILSRYAVDGIHYDDYFYPENTMQTATAHSFEKDGYTAYLQSGGSLSVADWRRAAVDSLVFATHTRVKQASRTFGISPAADAKKTYADMYADCLKWLSQNGYVDYLCPQLYTGFEHQGSPFDSLVDRWLSYPRHSSVKLYIGIATYKAGLKNDTYAKAGKTEWANNTDILKRQILYLRSKKVSGLALYSYSYLFPTEKAGLSKDNVISVAIKEIENLLSVL